MSKPVYSVLIVTYYHEQYIKKALDSVLTQNVEEEMEILVGDDGSQDNTVKILKEYSLQFPFIKIYDHENVGLSRNIYDLLKRAQGDYIAILEGDDYWIDEKKLIKQRKILEEFNCLATACNSLKVDNEGNELGLWNYKIKEGILTKKEVLHYQTEICHPSGIMCRNIFKNSGDEYDIIATASRMGGNHTGMINLLANEGAFYLDKRPMTSWRVVQISGAKNYSSQKLEKPINFYEAMQKYERYDKSFDMNYERHIYEEYSSLLHSLKKEFIDTVGTIRYYKGMIKFFFYKLCNGIIRFLRIIKNIIMKKR